jgi:nitrogen fixation protein NifZ
MIEPRLPRFQWGQQVLASVDLYNDGSHPDVPEDHLLIPIGGVGEVVQIGHHEEANVPVYMVDFGLAVIGCMEDEIELDTRVDAQPGSLIAADLAAAAATPVIAA